MDIYGNPVVYTGVNPLSLSATAGTVDTTWVDFTDYVEGLQDIGFSWRAEKVDNGKILVGKYATTKGVTSQLSFEREAYEFLKQWLVNDVAAVLNQVEVQITDTSCGRYVGYFIKSDQLQWCEFNSTCVFNVNLKQIEDFTNCIQRTVISDNWQGWFQNEPADGKKHPRFGYCIEKRPNWTLVLLWSLSSYVAILTTLIYTTFFPLILAIWLIRVAFSGLVTAINAVIGLINDLIDAVNTLLPGTPIPHIPLIDVPDPGPAPSTPVEVLLNWAQNMIESAGCGREHPAPLVRDYILNVCNKCGIIVDATTADTFFAPILSLTNSDGTIHTDPNPYYNACYFAPTVKRGVRRFRKINLFTGVSDPDTTTYYIPDNAPVQSLEQYLDFLSRVFNAQWRVIVESGTPTLYFKRKDWFTDNPPLYDFSLGGADRSRIVEGICYEQLDVTLPSYLGYLYDDDQADKCGVEANGNYNGVQHINFGSTVINPIFNGELEKKTPIGAARFNNDGVTGNYIYDALQVCYSLGTVATTLIPVAGGVALGLILDELGTLINNYADYKLLLQSENVTLPKILIWDGDTDSPSDPNYLNATAVRDKINISGTVYTIGHTPLDGLVTGIGRPLINTLYPTLKPATIGSTIDNAMIPDPLATWDVVHPVESDVIGAFPPVAAPAGVYQVVNIFSGIELSAPAILVNYPMYFEPHFLNTLWDRFHWIDDPVKYPRLNKRWSVKIPLCCEDLEKLQLVNGVNNQLLLSTVILDTAYYNVGIITEIRVSYEVGDDKETGQFIELIGIV